MPVAGAFWVAAAGLVEFTALVEGVAGGDAGGVCWGAGALQCAFGKEESGGADLGPVVAR